MLVNIHYFIKQTFLMGGLGLLMAASPAISQELSLDQCVNQALEHNWSIKISQEDILIARDKNNEAKSTLLPKLNGVADYRYYTDLPYQFMPAEAFGGPAGTYKQVQFGVPQNMNINAQLSVPIFNAAAYSAILTTREAILLRELQKTKTEEEVIMEVSNTYYNGQILRHQIAFLDSNILNMEKLVKTTSMLYQQQLAKATDVDRLKLQLEQMITQRITVFSQYRQVLNALKFLIGKPVTDTVEVSLEEKTYRVIHYNQLLTTDVKLIDKQLQLTDSEMKGLKCTRLPSLNAYGMYGTTGFGTTGSNSFFNFYPVSYLGVQMTIPLFNNLGTHRKIQQKKTELDKTNLQKGLLLAKTDLERTNALLQYQVAEKNLTTTAGQIVLAKKIYGNTVLQSEQGIASITDLLLADNTLREAQQNYISALVILKKTELEYKRVTGNLLIK